MQNHQPFTDAIDLEIIMLACAHFDQKMDLMIETIQNTHYHPLKKLPLERMVSILEWQQLNQQPLINLLPHAAQKIVEDSLNMYSMMQQKLLDDPDSVESKIYELILFVGEDAYSLIDTVVMESKRAVSCLIENLQNKKLFDPVYPGFGKSPQYLAECLKGIMDERAIAPLFDALLEQVGGLEEALLDAITSFSDSARDFLLKQLEKRPLSIRSSFAAKALNYLKNQPVALLAIDTLCDPATLKHPALVSYLIALLDAIEIEERADVLKQLLEEVHFSLEHKKEIELFI